VLVVVVAGGCTEEAKQIKISLIGADNMPRFALAEK